MPQINVKINNSNRRNRLNTNRLSRLVKGVCRTFTDAAPAEGTCEVSITMVGDAQIRRLNKKYLDKNTTTDCLSFDLSDSGEQSLFELIINTDRAAKEAKLRGHSTEAEAALYITHSLLHNLGFDDSTQAVAKRMHLAEDEILQQYGYGCVYNKNYKGKNDVRMPAVRKTAVIKRHKKKTK